MQYLRHIKLWNERKMADNVKANKMNSQADDDIGFGIYTDIADLPMTGCPSYIEEGIGGMRIGYGNYRSF